MLLAWGVSLWLVGTLILRVGGHYLLPGGDAGSTLLLFTAGFLGVAVLVRAVCRRSGLAPERWPAGAAVIAMPTMVVDPVTTVFFASAFPNMPPAAAGHFAALMLCCCAGAFAGALWRR